MITREKLQPHTVTRILVIDDSRSILMFVGELLREAGYSVSTASDGESGLALIGASEPDVVLLDVEMPGMSGLQVLETLAGKRPLYSIILFSTRSSLDQIVEGLTMGADDYVVKPFQPEELLARVEAANRSASLKRELARAHRQADEALTRLRETQSQLIAEKKVQAIAHLAAGVAHEINNPLGFIQSNLATLGRYAEFLLSLTSSEKTSGAASQFDSSDCSPADQKKLRTIRKDIAPLIQETQEGVFRIAEIVRKFLNLEQGIGVNDAQLENLNDILAGIVRCAAAELAPGIRLVFDPIPEPLPVMGVLTILNKVFDSLLMNAIEAIDSEGGIWIRTGRESDRVYCVLHDSGSGIKAGDYPRIFDPFFTTKLDVKHFGLGLTIAECFVHAHGGTIEVATSAGGTRVTVFLPYAERAGSGSGS